MTLAGVAYCLLERNDLDQHGLVLVYHMLSRRARVHALPSREQSDVYLGALDRTRTCDPFHVKEVR